MRRLFRLGGYGAAGLLLLGFLFPDGADVSGGSKASLSKTDSVMMLPNDPSKDGLLDAVPQPASAVRRAKPAMVSVAPDFVFVMGSRVNVRSGPNVSYKRLGAFDRGTRLTVLDVQNGWTRVSGSIAGAPVSGWMSSTYLGRSAPVPVVRRAPAPAPKRAIDAPSNAQISAARKTLISQSLAMYPGNCPCPYNHDRAGRRCGKRSAWSKPGGRSPLCYDSDITRSHLTAYFKRNGKNYP